MSGSMIARRSDDAFFKEPRQFPARSGNGKGFPIGPRTKKRAAENAKLNRSVPPEIRRRCELRVEGVCIGDRYLQWCHSKKSRYILTDADWQEAARGCAACHHYADSQKHSVMHAMITAAIKRRKPCST